MFLITFLINFYVWVSDDLCMLRTCCVVEKWSFWHAHRMCHSDTCFWSDMRMRFPMICALYTAWHWWQVVILTHTCIQQSDAHLTTRMTRPSQPWSYGIGGTPSIFNARAPHVIRARAYARASRVRAREGAIFLRHSSISFFDIIYQKGCHPEVVILTTSGRPSERYTQVL